jgi:hypothetical protein
MALVSVGAEIKSLPENGLNSFRIHGEIYHFVWLLYPNKVGQDTGNFTVWIPPKQEQNDVEKQSNEGRMAEVMQRLDEMLR